MRALPEGLEVRWTLGDVSPRGFEALRLSLWGAWKVFGSEASCTVCVNSVPVDEARRRTEPVPKGILWRAAFHDEVPDFLRRRLVANMAEGVGWKFAPLRLFPDHHELALDNDCILWEMPAAVQNWLDDPDWRRCVIAEDVRSCFGQFAAVCTSGPRNSGIRGLPPRYDLEGALRQVLGANAVTLVSETDEQGPQVAAISRDRPPWVVTVEEVSICSPFPPHLPHLGTCGAHFVGLNARDLPWSLENRPATEFLREHWLRHRDVLYEKVGVSGFGD